MDLLSERQNMPSSFQQDVDLFTSEKNIVHIRIQQRNGRKCITLVQGIADDLDLHKILKYLKKVYSTNGNIRTDPTYGEIIQLQGDQRKNVYDSLIEWQISPKEDIKVHGS
jgi:translation initiation factor 1